MRIIAYYLPQFHNIPENDEWWGDGFTEWVNVRAAKPLFTGHEQPRLPLNDNYYNLLDDSVKKWQADLARQYGVYGFCYYHYWFNGKMLLEKPMEQMLANKSIDLPFCISWANESWTKSWTGSNKEILILQKYGNESEWREHFEYLLPFFKDDRYIKTNGKPFFVIYRPEIIPCLEPMMSAWNKWAIEAGFPGISFAHQSTSADFANAAESDSFDYCIEYQPRVGRVRLTDQQMGGLKRIRRKISGKIEGLTGINLLRYGGSFLQKIAGTNRQEYGKIWDSIIEMDPLTTKSIPGAFSMWDNSPRYGDRAEVYINSSPKLFEEYLSKQIIHARTDYKTDLMLFFAWNEWCEGGILEPDSINGYGYLEAVKNALINTGEWPTNYSSDQ